MTAKEILMLVFTNREIQAGRTDAAAFQASFHPGADRVAVASVARDTDNRFVLSQIDDDVSEPDALDLLQPLFRGERPVLVYLHGNSNTPAKCFERCASLEARYDVEVVGFSWAAEGLQCDGDPLARLPAPDMPAEEGELAAISPLNRNTAAGVQLARRYHQARTNAEDSVDALARLLRHVATARLLSNDRPFSLAAHSLGAHFLQHALEVPGASESIGAAHNVVLLAPCVRADGHAGWVHQLRPRGRTYITFHKGDSVLFGAFVADGANQEKLGTAPGTDLLPGPAFRYVSFTNAAVGLGAHRYFIERVSDESRLLFGRLFRSEADVMPGEAVRKVYPFECEGSVCHMAVPDSARFDD
jgi:hypothetical protein